MINCHFCARILKQKVRLNTGFSASVINENFWLIRIVQANALVGGFSSTEHRCVEDKNQVAAVLSDLPCKLVFLKNTFRERVFAPSKECLSEEARV